MRTSIPGVSADGTCGPLWVGAMGRHGSEDLPNVDKPARVFVLSDRPCSVPQGPGLVHSAGLPIEEVP